MEPEPPTERPSELTADEPSCASADSGEEQKLVCGERMQDAARYCRQCGAILSDEPLRGFLPQPVLELLRELGWPGELAAATGDVQAGGVSTVPHRERLHELLHDHAGQFHSASVLFVDINGYTAMCERHPHEEMKDILDAYYAVCQRVVGDHNGFVVKFQGDGCMAVFGAPVAYERDAESAVRAALAIQRNIRRFPVMHGERITVSAGVETGRILSSLVGGEGGAYDIFGPAVNLAARIQGAAGTDRVLIGPETHRLVAHEFTVVEQPAKELKNVRKPVVTYEVTGLLSAVVASGDRRALSGRDGELSYLEEYWAGLLRRQASGRLFVVGPAGVGKTALTEEFVSRHGVAAQCLHVRVMPYDARTPWALWRSVLHLLARTEEDEDDPAATVNRMARGLGLSSGERRMLDAVMGDPGAIRELDRLGPTSARRQIAASVLRLFHGVAGARPVILVLDELQWADAVSLESLNAFLSEDFPAPVLTICCARARTDLAAVDPRLPEGLTLAPVEGASRFDDEESVRATIDKLSRDQRAVLDCAAVLGRDFAPDSIALFGQDPATVLGKLYELCGSGLLQEIVGGELLRFRFSTDSVRGVAYSSMLERRRRELHRVFAEQLEESSGNRLEANLALLAHHYTQGGDNRQALHYLQRAAISAKLLGATTESLEAFASALQILGGMPRTRSTQLTLSEVSRGRGAVLSLLGRTDESLSDLRNAMGAARRCASDDLVALARIDLANTLIQTGAYARARAEIRRALPSITKHENTHAAAVAWMRLGLCSFHTGKISSARRAFRHVLDLRLERRKPGVAADAWNNLALVSWRQGQLRRAAGEFDHALRLCRKNGNRFGLGPVMMNRGIIDEAIGDATAARKRYLEALAIAESLFFVPLQVCVHANLSNLALNEGDGVMALEHGTKSLELAQKTGDRRSAAIALENIALSHLQMGDRAACIEMANRGLSVARELGDEERILSLRLVIVESGIPAQASRLVAEADAIVAEMASGKCRSEFPRALRIRAMCHLAMSNRAEAMRGVDAALREARQQGNRVELGRIESLAAQLSDTTRP